MAQFTREAIRNTFKDYNGGEVVSTSFGKMKDNARSSMTASRHSSDSGLGMPPPEKLPLLIYVDPCVPATDINDIPAYFQVLADGGARGTSSAHDFCHQTNHDFAFEVMMAPQTDVFACVEHYRREKVHRGHVLDTRSEPSSEPHSIPRTYARRGGNRPPKDSLTSSNSSVTSLSSRSSSLQPSAAASVPSLEAHSNLFFFLDRPDWRDAGPVLVSWGLSTRQTDTESPESLIAAQTAINRGRNKLRATRISSEDVASCLEKIWRSSGGDDWALLEEDDEMQSLSRDSLPSLIDEDKKASNSSQTVQAATHQLQSQNDTQSPQHVDDTEADRRRALELAQPLEQLLQLNTPATSEDAPILRQNAIPGSTVPSLSVWSSRHGSEMPTLAFVLNIPGNKASAASAQPDTAGSSADDDNDLDNILPEDLSLRIFRALDLGVLQTIPWRLDVFSHAPSLQDVVKHYREEKASRASATTSDTNASRNAPLDYARSPYQRFRSILLLADTTTELTSHISLLLFDPIQHDKTTESPAKDDEFDKEEDLQSSDCLSSSRDLVSLVKFRLGCSGLPCDQDREHETPRLSRVLYALWDICNTDGERKRKPQMRSVNELLWF
jgi:hypothetical protein